MTDRTGQALSIGPLLGAVLLTIVNELLVIEVGVQPARIVCGALLIIVILVTPDGLMAVIEPLVRNLASRCRPGVREEVQL